MDIWNQCNSTVNVSFTYFFLHFCTCNAWVNKTFPDWNITQRMRSKIIGKGGGEAGISPRHHPGRCSDVSRSGESPDSRKSEPGREQRGLAENWEDLLRSEYFIFLLKYHFTREDWFPASLPTRNMLTPRDLIWDELYKRGVAIHCKIKASSRPIGACILLLKHHMITSLRKHS